MPCYIHKHPDTAKPFYRIGSTHDRDHKIRDIADDYFGKITQQWIIYDKARKNNFEMSQFIEKTLFFMLEKTRINKVSANYFEIYDISKVFKDLVDIFKILNIDIEIAGYIGQLRQANF